MPELPEVETIKRELQRAIVGKKIRALSVVNDRVIRQPAVRAFVKGVEGATVTGVHRRGKCLALALSTGKFLSVHLKMTGQFIYPAVARVKETRVTFHLTNGKDLDFRDRRLFGELRLLDDWQALPFVRTLGPEPDMLSVQDFQRLIADRRTAIKPFLMDQKRIAGIGNLYAAEALFRACIHPARMAGSLTAEESKRLFRKVRKTLDEAIEYKGSSVDQYVVLSGKQGGYARYHRVYARDKKPCLVCKTPIQRIRLGGRGTYLCPKCQK